MRPATARVPTDPVAADGTDASATSSGSCTATWARDGSLTVRLTSMTGTITYPPPDHDEIVSGLVPWAKTGIIVKDGTRQGSSYAALMMTGSHGVRFQHDYRHDIAGSARRRLAAGTALAAADPLRRHHHRRRVGRRHAVDTGRHGPARRAARTSRRSGSSPPPPAT